MSTFVRDKVVSVDQCRWQPSRWFKVRTRFAPRFPDVQILASDVGLQTRLEAPSAAVDSQFPPPRIRALDSRFPLSRVWPLDVCFAPMRFGRVLLQKVGAIVSDDLLAYAPILATDLDIKRLLSVEVAVSGDLFVPLRRTRNDGRVYGRYHGRADEDVHCQLLLPAIARDNDGYRKSFTERTDGVTRTWKTMTVWDLVFPLLQPPPSLDFPDSVALPSPLYPYQVDGVRFLLEHDSALLGDDMGTGKTVQTIVAMRILFQRGDVASALVVVPLSILKNWDRELLKWAPTLTPTVVRGTKAEREIRWSKPAHVWVTTYGFVRSDIDLIAARCHFDLVVLDEIQAIKNRRAQQSRTAKRLPRSRAWGLSGTPIENDLDDLCSLFDFLKPGLVPREALSNDAALRGIKPYFLRRRKQDVLPDLPEKKAFDHWLVLEDRQREVYERAEREGRIWLKELGAEVTVQHVLQLLGRLKMLCNRDPQSGESAKLELLEDKLDEAISEGSKALVFSQYLDEGVHFIAEKLSRYQPAIITGDARRNRDKEVDRFQNDEECKLLIATPKTGGVGLNLLAGNYVFHFDHWWNPATARQAEDRVHRIGQTKDVFVYHFWTENTVEERIRTIVDRKQRLYSDVIDELSSVESSGLSEEELFDLFDLKSPRRRTEESEASQGGDVSLDRLLALSPEEFESAVARLYQSLGFGTRVTPASRDRGVDVIASRTTAGGGFDKYAIQCKRYSPERNVGEPEARDLLGVLAKDSSFTKGVLITTSDFTRDCRQFATGQGNLELLGGGRLVRLMQEQKVTLA